MFADTKRAETTFIYAIEATLADGDRVYKIGHSRDPRRRLRQLQGANPNPTPLRLIACVEGTEDQELEIHESLESSRYNGEWFAALPSQIIGSLTALIPGAVLSQPKMEIETPSNEVVDWLDECASFDGSWTRDFMAFNGYRGWCERRGVAPLSQRTFGRRMRAEGLKWKKIDGQKVWNFNLGEGP